MFALRLKTVKRHWGIAFSVLFYASNLNAGMSIGFGGETNLGFSGDRVFQAGVFEERTTASGVFDLCLGVRVSPFLICPHYRAFMRQQITPISNVSDTNAGSSGFLIGGALGLRLGQWQIRGDYDFFGSQALFATTSDGLIRTYEVPALYRAAITRFFSQRIGLSVFGEIGKFRREYLGTGLRGTAAGEEMKTKSLGLALTFSLGALKAK